MWQAGRCGSCGGSAAQRSAHTAASLAGLGYLAQAGGENEAARRLFTDALTLFRQIGAQPAIAECLVGLAAVAGSQQPERAARLLGAAQAMREAIGASPAPAASADHERTEATVRAALGEAAFAAAWAKGQAMSMELAVQDALTEVESGAA